MYGEVYAQSNGTAFVPGLNEGVCLVGFSVTDTEYGRALDVKFEKDGSYLDGRAYEVNPEKVTPKQVWRNKVQVMETKEEAVLAAFGDFNSWVKSIVTAFISEEEYIAAITGKTTFEDFIEACKAALPEDFATRKGRLITTYNTKGYLSVPSKYWVTGNFFTTKPEVTLTVGKRVVTVKPEAPTNTAATNW